jgi:heme-degrading monooxygenase HmoA
MPDTERRLEMEAVMTRVVLNTGVQSEWEATMRDRMTAAESSDGWIGGSILRPDGHDDLRVIVGLWETRSDWERWHDDPAFHETAERLKGLESDAGTATWHDVVYAGGRFTDQ